MTAQYIARLPELVAQRGAVVRAVLLQATSLPLFTRLQTYRCAALSDVMGHSLPICFVLASYNVCSTPKADIRF